MPPPPAQPQIPSWLSAVTGYGIPIASELYGGLNLASAYGDAGKTAANAATAAGTEVNDAAMKAGGTFDPYINAGTDALSKLKDPNQILQYDPGYQFRIQQGQKALQNQLTSMGGSVSGEALKAMQDYSQNAASNEFGNAYNRAMGLANLGYGATQQRGLFDTQGASYQGNANTQAGLDLATGGIGAGQAQAIMANQIAQILMQGNNPSNTPSLAALIAKLTGVGGGNIPGSSPVVSSDGGGTVAIS